MTQTATPAAPASQAARFGSRRTRASLARDYGIVGAVVLLFVVLSATTPNFLTWENITNVLNQNAFVGIAACGATLVIIAGGFDLSVGAVYALSGAVAAWGAVHVGPGWGLLMGGAVGPLAGMLNASLITGLGLHSFLATLASSLAFSGLAVAVTGGFLIDATASSVFTYLGRGELIPDLPNPIIVFALVAVVLGLVLARTKFGRYVYAVGGNPQAARLSGVRVGRVLFGAFALSGLTASIAGLVVVSNSGTGQAVPGGATSLALDTIAAVVIGGTSIKGGQGAIWRTVIGVLLLALITNAFNILNVAAQYQDVLRALIIVAAVALNTMTRDR
jgi:ribose transport system permease protein